MNAYVHYNVIDDVLAETEIEQEAAEVHGLLTGYLCAGVSINRDNWLTNLLGLAAQDSRTEVLTVEQYILLKDLFDKTVASLNDVEMGLLVLLPDDEESLSVRLQALAAWCQGFVFGLNSLGKQLDTRLTPDSREALQDINDMMYLDKDALTPVTNEDESDYMQIVEYLRVVVVLLFCELANTTPASLPYVSSKQLH